MFIRDMPEITNTTGFRAELIRSSQGLPSTVILKATFRMIAGASALADSQFSLSGADMHRDDDPAHGVLYESDFIPFKPKADVLCVGKAHAPGGVPTSECLISFSVGPWSKTIRVVGDRQWKPLLGRFFAFKSSAKPFQSIMVSYENAYGGKDAGKPEGFKGYASNPIGKGYSRRGGGLKGLALPNLEDPKQRIGSWRSRPKPMSFGPVGRTWEPRIRHAGTYDKQWLKSRSPQLPEDFNEAFYNCAPEDQQMPSYLRGDEEVRVQNMHREHPDFRCRLPGIRIRALSDRKISGGHELEDITMNLDTLWVDMEALKLVLVWRGRVTAAKASEGGTVLIVEESLDAAPRPAESYRSELLKQAAEEQEAERTIEETEKELAALGAEGNP
jgi:hypothetical protein